MRQGRCANCAYVVTYLGATLPDVCPSCRHGAVQPCSFGITDAYRRSLVRRGWILFGISFSVVFHKQYQWYDVGALACLCLALDALQWCAVRGFRFAREWVTTHVRFRETV